MKHTDQLDQRGLPSSVETEKLILAALVKGTLDYRDCRAVLAPEDFHLESHRIIFHHAGELCEKGIAVDIATIGNNLGKSGDIEAIGGLSYLIDLDQNMPGLPRLDEYMRIVRDKSILRRTIAIADVIRNEAILGGDAPELLGKAEKLLTDLGMEAARSSEFHKPGEVIRSRGGLDMYLNRGMQRGVPTGFPRLDEMTCGMRPGQLWVLAASTSGGKSTLARNIALNAASKNYPGAFFTLEMTEDEVTDGLICASGEVDSQVIRRGMFFDRQKVRVAAAAIADIPLYIRDQANCTVPKVHSELRKLKAEKGIQWAIIDYLQLMTPVGRFGTRAEEVGHLSRGLKLAAHDLKITILALSQLKRLGETKRRPELNDLRESGSIENDSNVVMFLHSEWQASLMEKYPTDLIVAKQRGGPIGTIPFGFYKSFGRFEEEKGGNQSD